MCLQYDFDGVRADNRDSNSRPWIYAREVRAQQQGLPATAGYPYPSKFANHGNNLPLTTPGTASESGDSKFWLHHPVTPGTTKTWDPESGQPKGGVRSIYTEGDPNTFDVAYHNPNKKTPNGRPGEFDLARYVPAANSALNSSHSSDGHSSYSGTSDSGSNSSFDHQVCYTNLRRSARISNRDANRRLSDAKGTA